MLNAVPMHIAAEVLRHARQHGIDQTGLLAAAGISPTALAEGRTRIEPVECGRLVQAAARALDDELLGAGDQPIPHGACVMLCRLVVHTDDLATALRRSTEFAALFRGLPPLHLDFPAAPDPTGRARISFDTGGPAGVPRFLVELTLVVLHRLTSWLIGQRIPLHSAEFPFPAPLYRLEHEEIFGCPVRFDAPDAGFAFPAGYLTAPIVQNETTLRPMLRDAPTRLLGPPLAAATTTDRVRDLLLAGVRHRLPTAEEIAARLALSPRTLRRRLAAEGRPLHRIREDVCRETALASLRSGGEPLTELAARLGYSEPSAFHRAFKRWTGTTPARARSAPTPPPPHR